MFQSIEKEKRSATRGSTRATWRTKPQDSNRHRMKTQWQVTSRMKKARSKTGRVIGSGKNSKQTIRVLFEGLKTPVSLHQSYLELDKREP